ncbi:PQQ-dependent sugar dehydrogenase [Dyadobacter chenwenxiniae]|uniref:PQQ-dependent sugar dehydrogenase n=1 Tax=Dyadobacter chenwenxiniae TaxID=2906456 RepID=A0A9X1TIE3_9BACT|nr:PQQ-dependent sugar dehydrogenase [Dyadobacter chenwenxiniae]MCF0065770.1 PQQ-dependent sugar dehydrogenase [Dyadobacter chenwenxiniae]UON84142.1 PQQ-dependent sugar dehydrogenase [Dyadobacter chenwenxiniae]
MRKPLLGAFSLFIAFLPIRPLLAQTPKKPESNRFTKVVLAQRLEEPMQFQILKDGRVLYAERKGKLKVYDPKSQTMEMVAEFAVSTKYVNKAGEVTEGEDGMQGVILDPDYDKNHWIYIYYSLAGDEAKNVLVRYEWHGKELLESSRKVVMEVPVQREECCHVGGGMLFDKDKNLYLTTGDNTFSRASDGFAPLDERPGESPRDSQKSSPNTNDLRGKILRIHPEPDGSYTIPKGNLFPPGTPQTKPEIYTMGNRNPWRPTIDSKTGWLYWGEVGPDGSRDDIEKRGPQSYDEFNRAKGPGFYGWPYFVANNKAYVKYDFATKVSGEPFDAAHPVNNSRNSSGLKELPAAQPAFIWYSKAQSQEFPLMESGGNSAVGGPVFRKDDFKNASRLFPEYYEGKWFITDWVRGWINVVEMDENGEYKSMERFLPDLKLKGPIDMKFGPDGDLYVLEYGNGYFKDNPEAELIRIEYNSGNRKPLVEASASKTAGALPMQVTLSSEGTKDFDEDDALQYEWVVRKNNAVFKTLKDANPSITFTTPGTYQATLTVTDKAGEKNTKSVEIKAGNEPPVVEFKITKGNSTFYFPGKSIDYEVRVSDKEDGSLANKKIAPSQVSVSTNYLSEGFNLTRIAQKQMSVDASAQYATAISLINNGDCKACHAIKEKVLGPSFTAISAKYKGDPTAVAGLSKKILNGGSGVWGDAFMPAHPTMAESDVKGIVRYIMSLSDAPKPAKTLPVKGTYTTAVPKGDTEGSFIFRAAYADRGTKIASSQSSESTVVLRNPVVPVTLADEVKEISFNNDSTMAFVRNSGASFRLKGADLTGIKHIEIIRAAGRNAPTPPSGTIEAHAGSADGILLGKFSGEYSDRMIFDIAAGAVSGVKDVYFVFTGAPIRIKAVRFGAGE